MVYLIFCDGVLRSVSTDKTDASIQMHALKKAEGYSTACVIAINGHVHDEVYDGDREAS